MTYHLYRCMHCNYEPIKGAPGIDPVGPCECPSPEIVLPATCPIYKAFKEHQFNVHNIVWG